MPTLPRDLEDLRLAPVLLSLDAQIEDLARLVTSELAARVTLESGMLDRTPTEREKALLESVRHCIGLHGWHLTRDPRGVRLTHGAHTLVLGAPASFEEYVGGSAQV
ncbi:MAG: hypothetical protein JWN08_2003 [Frankiales bacterium]|nr:hypothetical protein [Frankiales bacterium]